VGGDGGGGEEAADGQRTAPTAAMPPPASSPLGATPPPQTVGPALIGPPPRAPSPSSAARRAAALEAEFEAAMGACDGGGDGSEDGDAMMVALLADADAVAEAEKATAARTAAAVDGEDDAIVAVAHPAPPVTGEAGCPGRPRPAPPTGCGVKEETATTAAAAAVPSATLPTVVNPAARPARFIVLEVGKALGGGHGVDARLLSEDGSSGLYLRLRGPWADADLAPGDSVALSSLLADGSGGDGVSTSHAAGATAAPTVGVPTRPVPRNGGGPGGEPAFTLGPGTGVLVTHPDLLLSGTRVAGALRCVRQAALEEKFGGEPGRAAAVGTLTHEVFAAALTGVEGEGGGGGAVVAPPPPPAGSPAFAALLEATADEAARRAPDRLIEVGLDEGTAAGAARAAVPAIAAFVRAYMPGGGRPAAHLLHHHHPAPVRGGAGPAAPAAAAITAVRDVEEVVWAPAVGVKGVVDATVAVNFFSAGPSSSRAPPPRLLHSSSCAPLEFKTGKRHGSHRAQVSLYLALAASRYGSPGPPAGLLWYTGDPVPDAVPAHGGEAASLVCARNALAGALAPRRSRRGGGGGSLVVDAPMLRDPRACGGCFQGAACAAVHAAVEGGTPETAGLAPGAFEGLTGHLTPHHAAFLAHWLRCLDAEEAAGGARRAEIWTLAGPDREARGRAASGLALAGSAAESSAGGGGGGAFPSSWLHTFVRAAGGGGGGAAAPTTPLDEVGLSVGDMAVIGLDGAHPCVSRATVVGASAGALVVRTDRRLRVDLAPSPPSAAAWRVDRDEPATAFVRQRRALLALFKRGEVGGGGGADVARLRRLVVELAPPSAGGRRGLSLVEARLAATLAAAGEVGGVHSAEPLPADCPVPPAALAAALAALNPDQRAAVDAALRARDYALILGLPGTGKTAATVAAVAAAVACGARVLVASYTNAAVDNVMLRLADLGVAGLLRVGRAAGVHPGVRRFLAGGDPDWAADPSSAAARPTAAELAAAASSAPVVGATVLGCENALVKIGGRFDLAFVDEAGQVK